MREIKHRQQTTPTNCTSACLAMILDRDVDDVAKEFHEAFKSRKTDPAKYLSNVSGISLTESTSSYDNLLEWDSVFLLTVPSLNIEGGLHSILVDTRDYEGETVRVFDPNKGKDGKRYYIGWDKNPKNGEVCLHGWIKDMRIEL